MPGDLQENERENPCLPSGMAYHPEHQEFRRDLARCTNAIITPSHVLKILQAGDRV